MSKRRDDGLPGAAIKRIEAATLAGVLGAEYGTPVGKMLLAGDLTRPQYDAARWFARLDADYRRAIGLPDLRSSSAQPGGHAEPPDPESEAGARMARSDASKVRAFGAAARAAEDRGRAAYRMFYACAVMDVEPARLAPTRALAIPIIVAVAEALRQFRERAGRRSG